MERRCHCHDSRRKMKEADRLNLEEKRGRTENNLVWLLFLLLFLSLFSPWRKQRLKANRKIWAGCSSKHQDYISFFAYFPFHPNTSSPTTTVTLQSWLHLSVYNFWDIILWPLMLKFHTVHCPHYHIWTTQKQPVHRLFLCFQPPTITVCIC